MTQDKTRLNLENNNSTEKLARPGSISIKLNDRSIQATKDFIINGKQKDIVSYRFEECRGKNCQGLRMEHHRKTGRKVMILDYWLNTPGQVQRQIKRTNAAGSTDLVDVFGKSKKYYLGDYDKTNFNVSHIEKKIFELRKLYGNKHNLTWDQDIHLGEKITKRDRFLEQQIEGERYTIGQCIQGFVQENCPKIKDNGDTLNRKTIQKVLLFLLGYHQRKNYIKIHEDENFNGRLSLTKEFNSWAEFWKRFPSQHKDTFKQGVSIYDGPLNLMVVEDLTESIVREFLAAAKNTAEKKHRKVALKYVWAWAKMRGKLKGRKGIPIIDPFADIRLVYSKQTQLNELKTKEYSDEELTKIINGLWQIVKEGQYPFQAEAYLLQAFTGRRLESILKLDWSLVKEEYKETIFNDEKVVTYGTITVSEIANKIERADTFPITKNVKLIIDSLKKTRENLGWTRFVKWLFPSPRTNQKGYLRKGNENNSFFSRLKDPDNCWERLREIVGTRDIHRKTFRKTYMNKIKHLADAMTPMDVITISGHEDYSTYEGKYMNKDLSPKVLRLFNKLDQDFLSPSRKTN